jgi:hypothetical protein
MSILFEGAAQGGGINMRSVQDAGACMVHVRRVDAGIAL